MDCDDPGAGFGNNEDEIVGASHIDQQPMEQLTSQPIRIVCSLDRLLHLAEGKCSQENCSSWCSVTYELCGFCIVITGACQNGHIYKWETSSSQMNDNGSKVYVGNLDFASAIL